MTLYKKHWAVQLYIGFKVLEAEITYLLWYETGYRTYCVFILSLVVRIMIL